MTSDQTKVDNQEDVDLIGLPGETIGRVEESGLYNASLVIGIEEPFVDESFVIAELDVKVGTIIPLLPLDAATSSYRAAVCTDHTKWDGERVGERKDYQYPDTLHDCFEKSETVNAETIEKLTGLIAKQHTLSEATISLNRTDFIDSRALVDEPSRKQKSSRTTSVTKKTKGSEQTQSDPPLTEETESYQTTQKRRDNSFVREVKEAYNERCAVCGNRRISPNGNPEVEAAHIYPKHKGGSDTIENGIALCRLHHWAFDVGWITITEDYIIRVADRPNLDGYSEFQSLEGEEIILPDNNTLQPHEKFLSNHKSLHGFPDFDTE